MSENKLEITTASEFEIKMTRSFDAPRARVWEALTKPELLQRWLLGPDGWTMPVCEFDLRPGGSYRYVWRSESDGSEFGMGGVFREVTPPEQFVATEGFDHAWYPGEALVTNVFTEDESILSRVRCATTEKRRATASSPQGWRRALR